MRHTIRRTIIGTLAGMTAVALNLAVGVSGALAKTATAATAATGSGATTGSGQDLMNLAQTAGSDVHTLALIAIGAGMAVTAAVTMYLHKWKSLLVGMGIAIFAFMFVNGGAANIANNTSNKLAGGQSSQVSGGSGIATGIPGVSGP
jgi:hypothetical protein